MAEVNQATIEELLEHEAWLKRLARSLVGDTSAADDLVQNTWLAAIRRPPLGDRPLRPWLARVVRNFASEERRRRGRAVLSEEPEEFERELSEPSSAPVEANEVRVNVVEALMHLREPYRTTVMLRYYGGLEPQDIASRQGVPSATVRTRLRRGLLELRETMGKNWKGSEESLLAGLMFWADWGPLESGGVGAATVTASQVGVRTAIGALVLGGGAVVAGLAARSQIDPGPEPAAVQVAALPDQEPTASNRLGERDLAPSSAGLPSPAGASSKSALSSEPDAARIEELALEESEGTVVGLVLNGDQPWVDVEAILVPGERRRLDEPENAWPEGARRARTDAEGVFRFDEVNPGKYVLAVQVGDVMRQRIYVQPEGKTRRSVWIFGSSAIHGRVWNMHGAPAPGTVMRLQRIGPDRHAGFQAWMETDESGGYSFEKVPQGQYVLLSKYDPAVGDNWFNNVRRELEVGVGETLQINVGSSEPWVDCHGAVRNRSGDAPAEAGQVLVRHVESGFEFVLPCDEEGRLHSRLPAGEFDRVRWTPKEGRRQDLIALPAFELTAGGSSVELEIDGARLWGQVDVETSRGRVYAQREGATERSRPRSTVIDTEGFFYFEGVEPGRWRVWTNDAMDAANVDLRPEESSVRIDLQDSAD